MIRLRASREIEGVRGALSKLNPFLRAPHEERCLGGEGMEAFEIEVGAIHDADGIGLNHQIVEEGRIRAYAISDLHDRRDQQAQIHLRVQREGRVRPSIASPRKHGKTEVDNRHFGRVDSVRESDGRLFVDAEVASVIAEGAAVMCSVLFNSLVAEVPGQVVTGLLSSASQIGSAGLRPEED
jgi:hypothetical protein